MNKLSNNKANLLNEVATQFPGSLITGKKNIIKKVDILDLQSNIVSKGYHTRSGAAQCLSYLKYSTVLKFEKDRNLCNMDFLGFYDCYKWKTTYFFGSKQLIFVFFFKEINVANSTGPRVMFINYYVCDRKPILGCLTVCLIL